MDFVLADRAQSGAIYFMASEEDLRTGLSQPWTSIGLDAGEMSLDGPTYEPHTHPRAMGSMPRFLGNYVRGEHLMPLEAAIRKITSFPAQREHLEGRGLLKPGYFADITIFDPAAIIDHATFTKPDQLSDGIGYTIVNGQVEYDQGKLTAGRPDEYCAAAVGCQQLGERGKLLNFLAGLLLENKYDLGVGADAAAQLSAVFPISATRRS